MHDQVAEKKKQNKNAIKKTLGNKTCPQYTHRKTLNLTGLIAQKKFITEVPWT